MDKPSIGRIVHAYFEHGYADQTENHPICVAGIITRITEYSDGEAGVELQLFPAYPLSASMLMSGNRTMPLRYSEKPYNATWHWPERL